MCGILGIIGNTGDVVPSLVDGLKRLEYRGYDSAGIATLCDGNLETRRAAGKLENLVARLNEEPLHGSMGIGHTRWATHGVPNEVNAHPQTDGRVAVVHNGIIENYLSLRNFLVARGRVFTSDTDTEVVVHLIAEHLAAGASADDAVRLAIHELEGAFALGILITDEPECMYAARKGSPLAIGFSEGAMVLGSDAIAIAPITRKIVYLEDGDWARMSATDVAIFDEDGQRVQRPEHISAVSGAMIGKGEYRHFMLKEIYEQPQVMGDTLNSFFNPLKQTITLPEFPFYLKDIKRITVVACGTSYYAGLVARTWMEQICRLPVDIDVASEFRYRAPPLEAGGLAVFISQSGETADTLAALRHCRAAGLNCLSIVNVPESTMARESDGVLHTLAGPEIGVASTKAFTTQLVALACLSLAIALERQVIDLDTEHRLSFALSELPARAAEVLGHDETTREIAQDIMEARDVLYLGRGTSHAIALEGALKLKEISYIHAEGYPAGEMKHGPIALIDESVPVVIIAPSDDLFEKTFSNLQEAVARGGNVILLTDEAGAARVAHMNVRTVVLPAADAFTAPILYAIPVQLLAYHIAVLKGTDVDQPRNLAKSVTVE